MSPYQRDFYHKRWTLNVLIQGAASHIHMTAPHMVREQLDNCIPGLTDEYIRFVLWEQLNYVSGDLMLMQGRPNRWWGWSSKPQAVIADHPVLSLHGNDLVRAEARSLRERSRRHGVRMIPLITPVRLMRKIKKLAEREIPHREQLVKIAVDFVTSIYDIPPTMLEPSLTLDVAFGQIGAPDNFMSEVLTQSVVGYGGVDRRDGDWKVIARAWVFPLLVHELIKGITELVCMHGMSEWDEGTYRTVTTAADRLELETLCIQIGPELWRRLLAVAPRDIPLARLLMHIAKQPPEPLHALINQVITDPEMARVALVDLTREAKER